ncbi:hypothetical protein ES332_A05G311500v1 [Gossypium tomentosum]|uniref:Uncharacterized protein n=1 Tax=Gossypium tomentosum TaxID=34277 RepID=A0A5D2QQ10_GOSTO|nr:hypothetical protein ES332_A05G311500v1 [Gossypium tomentosum]
MSRPSIRSLGYTSGLALAPRQIEIRLFNNIGATLKFNATQIKESKYCNCGRFAYATLGQLH